MKMIGILQPSYLPWLGCFEQISRCDAFIFYDDVAFDRHGWRNRNRIKGADGPVWLTVPVHASRQKCVLRLDAVHICTKGPSWKQKHLHALQTCYGKSPFFKHYMPEFKRILEQQHDFLCGLNIALTQWLCQCLAIQTPMVRSSQLHAEGDRQHRLINLVRALDGNCFYEGAAGKNYIDTNLFLEHGIKVVFQDYPHPTYPQPHGAFISHLSTLDALFNCGQDAKMFIANSL